MREREKETGREDSRILRYTYPRKGRFCRIKALNHG